MAKMNIKEADLVTDVRAVSKEIEKREIKSENSDILFFGNLDVSMQEIDAAIKKLQMLSAQRSLLVCDGI